MTAVPFSFWSFKRLINTPSFTKTKTQKRDGHSIFFSPSAQILALTFVLKNYLSSRSNSVSKLGLRCQRIFNTPSVSQSPCKAGDAKFFRPSGNVLSLTVEGNVHVRLYVRLLFLCVRPSAIFFVIAQSAIDAVNRFSFWPLAHVFQKILERRSPSLANRDPLRAIHRVFGMRLPVTPSNHVLVSVIGPALGVVGCMAVLAASYRCAATSAAKLAPTIPKSFAIGLHDLAAMLARLFNRIGFVCHELIIAHKAGGGTHAAPTMTVKASA